MEQASPPPPDKYWYTVVWSSSESTSQKKWSCDESLWWIAWGNSSSCEGQFLKCFSFPSMKYCPVTKHWWMSYAGHDPSLQQDESAFSQGAQREASPADPWTRALLKHFDPAKHAEQPPAGTASEEPSHRLPVPWAARLIRIIRCTKIWSYAEKHRELGAVKQSKGL